MMPCSWTYLRVFHGCYTQKKGIAMNQWFQTPTNYKKNVDALFESTESIEHNSRVELNNRYACDSWENLLLQAISQKLKLKMCPIRSQRRSVFEVGCGISWHTRWTSRNNYWRRAGHYPHAGIHPSGTIQVWDASWPTSGWAWLKWHYMLVAEWLGKRPEIHIRIVCHLQAEQIFQNRFRNFQPIRKLSELQTTYEMAVRWEVSLTSYRLHCIFTQSEKVLASAPRTCRWH